MDLMETFMLASVNEKNGALLNSRSILTYGLAGIAAYELLKSGRISFDGKRIVLSSISHTGDVLLDEAIDFIAKKQAFNRSSVLVGRLAYKINKFARRLMERLEDDGILRIEQKRFLGLIPYDRYIISRIKEHKRVLEDIREIIRRGDMSPEPDKAFLISILSAARVLGRLFDRNEKYQMRDKLRKIGKADHFRTLDVKGKELHKAVKAAIAAAQAATS